MKKKKSKTDTVRFDGAVITFDKPPRSGTVVQIAVFPRRGKPRITVAGVR